MDDNAAAHPSREMLRETGAATRRDVAQPVAPDMFNPCDRIVRSRTAIRFGAGFSSSNACN
jgi:hypothetical protein